MVVAVAIMDTHLTLTQLHIRNFLECRRRFELRYLTPFVWPEPPYLLETEQAFDRGRAFHKHVEQHFLGLAPRPSLADDPLIRTWWGTFESAGPTIPDGRRYPEISLAVPLGGHQLFGRFDLLVLSPTAEGEVAATLFDWKTSKAQPEARLRAAWQTRLYLALLAEGGHTLIPGRTTKLNPDLLSMTYWYVGDPEHPRTIAYGRAMHQQNWQEIGDIVAQIEAARQAAQWPLTDDWSRCRDCAYQTLCGRNTAATTPTDAGDLDDLEIDDVAEDLAPSWK